MRIVGIVLLVCGIAALVWGGFSYTRDETALQLGPVEVTVEKKESVNVPVWAGAGLAGAGGLLLLVGSRRRP